MYDIYTIKNGDTIESISNKFNISPANLYKLNGFTPDYILQVGANIIVPKIQNPYFNYYTVQKGDNLYKIAQNYNINEDLLAELNGLNKQDYIYPNQVIVVPKKGVNIYITKEGDTISSVSENLKTNVAKIVLQNETIYLLPEQLIVSKNS